MNTTQNILWGPSGNVHCPIEPRSFFQSLAPTQSSHQVYAFNIKPATKFVLPDLVSHYIFTIHVSRHCKQVTTETKKWLFKGDSLQDKIGNKFHGLKAGTLTVICYPDPGYPNCMTRDYVYPPRPLTRKTDRIFLLLQEDGPNRSVAGGSATSKPAFEFIGVQDYLLDPQFIETFDFFFQSVTQRAQDCAAGVIPDLESYIALRRDTSGGRPSFVLIEYANNLNIPDEVMDHPLIASLGEAANDLVTCPKVLRLDTPLSAFTHNDLQGDTHNMIPVVMHEQGMDLQSAVDFVTKMCKQSLDRFNAQLPSWGAKIGRDVDIYVNRLANWIVGSLHWSFMTERYLGRKGASVKTSCVVDLLPLWK
ncbi:isoprenoid synthase domain-containing protein [Mycena sanguinolenta]|nr:isoprenoid synthase domain-containing protein [Mycena sanguinolenta]